MGVAVKSCAVFGCTARASFSECGGTDGDTDSSIYICNDCIAVAVIFCPGKKVVSETSSVHALVRVDDCTVKAVCAYTEDGVFR